MEQKNNILKTEKLELEILADKASFLESQVRRHFQFVLFTLTAISFITSSYLLTLYLPRSCVKCLKDGCIVFMTLMFLNMLWIWNLVICHAPRTLQKYQHYKLHPFFNDSNYIKMSYSFFSKLEKGQQWEFFKHIFYCLFEKQLFLKLRLNFKKSKERKTVELANFA